MKKKMAKTMLAVLLGWAAVLPLAGQTQQVTLVVIDTDEYWWGGAVGLGGLMPYTEPLKRYDLALQNNNNQTTPLLISNKGRIIWSDYPFAFEFGDREIRLYSAHEEIRVRQAAGRTLRDAYLAASECFFPPTGVMPDSLFFVRPQYNTWIELQYDQSQEAILRYAREILERGFPPGILMIDDNWQRYYGNFDFKAERFSDPRAMIDTLHAQGFKIMLWVCPFVSADSPEYRYLAQRGFLVRQRGSRSPAVISWWNGQSACLDLTHPGAVEWLTGQLSRLQQAYGVDGFKFDAGDPSFYDPRRIESYRENTLSVDHTEAWARIGLLFPFNEFRAAWKMGGEALVQRLGDKNYDWESGVQRLIPDMIAAGLLGYPYCCPDMIGGGQISSFVNRDLATFDKQLFVRSAQLHALMPMMQFSVSPWRILDEKQVDWVRQAVEAHSRLAPYLLACARQAARSGEPIVRHMEYMFPGEGFATCHDQYMLGDRILVAPMVTPGTERYVQLPKGRWRDHAGRNFRGGKRYRFTVPEGQFLYFERD